MIKKIKMSILTPGQTPVITQKSMSFAQKTNAKRKIMCAIHSTFLCFERLMDTEKVYRNPDISFRNICRQLSVSPSSLNEILLDEIGMNGDELIDFYRHKDNICITSFF